MGWKHPAEARQRVRRAEAALKRLNAQEVTLATRYGQAQTPAQRVGAAIDALRAAGSPGSHQVDQAEADRVLDAAADYLRGLVARLHAAQRAAAKKTLNSGRRTTDGSSGESAA